MHWAEGQQREASHERGWNPHLRQYIKQDDGSYFPFINKTIACCHDQTNAFLQLIITTMILSCCDHEIIPEFWRVFPQGKIAWPGTDGEKPYCIFPAVANQELLKSSEGQQNKHGRTGDIYLPQCLAAVEVWCYQVWDVQQPKSHVWHTDLVLFVFWNTK